MSRAVQYGLCVKAQSVYLSQYQLLPYQRLQDYFAEQCNLPISVGSIFNFNKEAYDMLEEFDSTIKNNLINANIAHADETGINVGGKRIWLHSVSNNDYAYLFSHEKRGRQAMEEIGIIPCFKGVLIHDHWKPYFSYNNCAHALCNAHHLRELECAKELFSQKWASDMQDLLREMNDAVKKSGGALSNEIANKYIDRYGNIIELGIKECPIPPVNGNLKVYHFGKGKVYQFGENKCL